MSYRYKQVAYIIICLFFTAGVWAQPVANFTVASGSKASGCPPLVVQFSNTSTGATAYEWDFGVPAPNTSTLKDPQWIFYKPGTYTIKLTAKNGTQNDVETKVAYITVHDTPRVDFTTNTTTGCAPLTVNFNNLTVPNAPSATYAWYLGAGVPATSPLQTPPPVVYNNGGTVTITLEATNSYGCKTYKSRPNYINIKSKPQIAFTGAPLTFCKPPGEVTFGSTITGNGPYKYLWRFGDMTTDTAANPKHIYTMPSPQSYNVKLIATDINGCKDSLEKPAYVNFVKTIANFQSPATVCVGVPINFANTSTPCITTASWNFDDPGGNTSADIHPIYSYASPGTKNIKMAVTCGQCTDTVVKSITVHPNPVIDFIVHPDSPCAAPQTIQFEPNSVSYSSYYWEFGSLPSSNLPTSTNTKPTRTYADNGFDTVKLTVTDGNGCSGSVRKAPAVQIYDVELQAAADTNAGCIPLKVDFSGKAWTSIETFAIPISSSYPPGTNMKKLFGIPADEFPWGVKSWEWDFDDGTKAYTANPTKIYTDTGNFKVKVKIITNNGCVAYDTVYVKAGIPPNASFITPGRVCKSDSLIFPYTYTTPPPVDEVWWDFGDGTRKRINEHIYKMPGSYIVSLVTLFKGCPSDTFRLPIVVDSPTAAGNPTYFCHKDSLRYVRFRNGSVGADSWTWFFGDGTSSSNTGVVVHQYPASGTYKPFIVAYNSAAGCTDTFRMQVTVQESVINFTANDTAVCKGDKITFTATFTGLQPGNFSWFINSSLKNFPPTPAFTFDSTFSDTGSYNIEVATTDEHGCIHRLEKKNYVIVSKPYVNFTNTNPIGCTPHTVTFTDASKVPWRSGIAKRVWDLGTPPVIDPGGAVVSRTYPNVGLYTPKLVITDIVGCKDSLEIPNYISANKPVAAYTVKENACLNEQLGFTNTSANYVNSYWTFGDNGTSNAASPIHTYTQLGAYDVQLIVEDQYGCRDTVKNIAKVKIDKPNPSFVMSDSVAVCPPFVVNFTHTMGTLGTTTLVWKTGLNNIMAPSATEAYVNPGVYEVTLVASSIYGCQDSVRDTVTLYGFAGSLTYDKVNGCVPLEVTFSPKGISNVPSITWDFTDGNTLTTSTFGPVKHTYTTSGAYLPKLVLEDAKGCKSTSDGLDTIKVDEAFAGFRHGPVCAFGEAQFFDTSKALYSVINGYIWTFDTSGNSNKKNPVHKYGAAGEYNVKLIVNSSNNCKDTVEKMITVNPLPDIDAGADTIICLRDSAYLWPSGGVSYIWGPKEFLSCDSCTHPLAGPKTDQKFVVIGIDANGCANKDTVSVKLKYKVVSEVGPGGEICDKDTIGLAVWGAQSYEWRPSESLNNHTAPYPIASPRNTTNYMVVAFEGRCIPDTNYVKVIVHPLPTVKAEGSTTIVAGKTADIRASGERIRTFLWEPSETLNCSDCAFPTAKPSATTTYTVFAYTDMGCVDSSKVTIEVLCDESQLFIPNTFTPNGDGQNDMFYPRGDGMEKVQSFRIFNRWGELVYERRGFDLNDAYAGWDGTYKGNQLSPDVFVWVIEAQCDDGKVLTLKGDVTILR